MFARKIIALASGAVVVAGAGFGVVTASAASASTLSVNCSFSGTSGPLNPPIPAGSSSFAPTATGNTNPDEGNPAYTTASSGAYTFDQTGPLGVTCVIADASGEHHSTTATIHSPGHYYNISCGTGEAYSTAADGTVVTATSGSDTYTASVTYLVQFVGGQGTLVGDATVSKNGVGEGTVDVTGPVSITPHTPGECVTGPVNAFDVKGSVHGSVVDED